MRSDAMAVRPLNEKNVGVLGGCDFKEIIQGDASPWKGAVIMTFNDPYLKVNIDVIFASGELFISDRYGENMNRNEVDYAVMRSRGEE